MPALVAIKNDPNARAFYEHLVARGKTPKQAVIALMRKRLHAIFGILKSRQHYDPDKFFPIAA